MSRAELLTPDRRERRDPERRRRSKLVEVGEVDVRESVARTVVALVLACEQPARRNPDLLEREVVGASADVDLPCPDASGAQVCPHVRTRELA